MKIDCLPPDHPLGEKLAELAAGAAERLELPLHLARLRLCLDDLDADPRVWLSFGRLAGEGPSPRRTLTLYLHPDHLLRDRPAATGFQLRAPAWESVPPPPAAESSSPADLSPRKAERFLFHQLLFARDLCERRLVPDLVPGNLVEAFQEIWAVTVDGRLRQARQPGYSVAERRRRFLRVFSTGGVLLPEHWRIFHDLWEGEDVNQAACLEMVRRLPRLRRFGS